MTYPDYFKDHRGGSGAVVLVIAVNDHDISDRQHAIFGSIEKAMAWRDTLGDDVTVVYSPYVVDEPEFGNAIRT